MILTQLMMQFLLIDPSGKQQDVFMDGSTISQDIIHQYLQKYACLVFNVAIYIVWLYTVGINVWVDLFFKILKEPLLVHRSIQTIIPAVHDKIHNT